MPAYSSNSQPQATMDSGCFAENVLRKDRQSHAESALGRAKVIFSRLCGVCIRSC